jgi:FkbM family methyltransferase
MAIAPAIAQLLRDLHAVWFFDNRWTLLLERTLLRGGNLSIYRTGSMEILMDKAAGDQSGARYVLTSPMYRQFLPAILPALNGNSNSNSNNGHQQAINVLDIGANVGGFTLLLALENIAVQKVVAVELHPATFVRLRLNLERNVSAETRCINAAVYTKNEPLDITLGHGDTGDNIFGTGAGASLTLQTYTIQGRTFDNIVEEHFAADTIDVCKMDIEGAEYDILLGDAAERLKQCRFLIIEIHPHPSYTSDSLKEQLQIMGFEEVFVHRNVASEDVFLFRNVAIS